MYTTPSSYWQNYPKPYGRGWKRAPIPGWGTKTVMGGPRMVAVNGFGAVTPGDCPAKQKLIQDAMRQCNTSDPGDACVFAKVIVQAPKGMASTTQDWDAWCAAQPGGGGAGAVVGGAATYQAPPVVQAQPPTTASMTGGGMPSSLVWIGAAVLVGGGLALAMKKGWIGKKSAAAA